MTFPPENVPSSSDTTVVSTGTTSELGATARLPEIATTSVDSTVAPVITSVATMLASTTTADITTMQYGPCHGMCGRWNYGRSCGCDAGCESVGDCCSGFRHTCSSCVGQCGLGFYGLWCHCDDTCERMGDCCSDYRSVCTVVSTTSQHSTSVVVSTDASATTTDASATTTDEISATTVAVDTTTMSGTRADSTAVSSRSIGLDTTIAPADNSSTAAGPVDGTNATVAVNDSSTVVATAILSADIDTTEPTTNVSSTATPAVVESTTDANLSVTYTSNVSELTSTSIPRTTTRTYLFFVGSCALRGCGQFGLSCSCMADCASTESCCSDYDSVCTLPPTTASISTPDVTTMSHVSTTSTQSVASTTAHPFTINATNGTAELTLGFSVYHQTRYLALDGISVCHYGSAAVYRAVDSSVSCLPCQQHTYSSARNLSVVDLQVNITDHQFLVPCHACPIGTFTQWPGSSVCTSCNASAYYSPLSFRRQCNVSNTCGVMHGVTRDYRCLPCVPGTVEATGGRDNIRSEIVVERAIANNSMVLCDDCVGDNPLCPPELVNASCEDCVRCKRGYAAGPDNTCVACRPGTYNVMRGASVCEPCPAGLYAYSPASIACVPDCADTYYRLRRGTFDCVRWEGAVAPMRVKARVSFFARRSLATVDTITRSYGLLGNCAYPSVPYGNNSCAECPYGTVYAYDSYNFTASCILCPAGTYDDRVNASTPHTVFIEYPFDACTTCSVGTYQASIGATSCYRCPPDTFANTTGQLSCDACPDGFTTNGTYGASACVPVPVNCTVGTVNQNDTCVPCPLGTAGAFHAENATAFCKECQPGYYTDLDGYVNSRLYDNTTDLYSCIPCIAGTFQPYAGRTGCYMAPPGEYSSFHSTMSYPCPIGQYAGEYGMSACHVCAPGTFTHAIGSTACSILSTPTADEPSTSMDVSTSSTVSTRQPSSTDLASESTAVSTQPIASTVTTADTATTVGVVSTQPIVSTTQATDTTSTVIVVSTQAAVNVSDPPSSDEKSTTAGDIVMIVCFCIIGVVVIVLITSPLWIFACWRRRKDGYSFV